MPSRTNRSTNQTEQPTPGARLAAYRTPLARRGCTLRPELRRGSIPPTPSFDLNQFQLARLFGDLAFGRQYPDPKWLRLPDGRAYLCGRQPSEPYCTFTRGRLLPATAPRPFPMVAPPPCSSAPRCSVSARSVVSPAKHNRTLLSKAQGIRSAPFGFQVPLDAPGVAYQARFRFRQGKSPAILPLGLSPRKVSSSALPRNLAIVPSRPRS